VKMMPNWGFWEVFCVVIMIAVPVASCLTLWWFVKAAGGIAPTPKTPKKSNRDNSVD